MNIDDNSHAYEPLEVGNEKNTGSYYEVTRQKNKISIFIAFLIFIKTTLGLGLMVIPKDFADSGFVLGTLIMIFVICIMYFCSILLIKAADDIEDKLGIDHLENMENVYKYFSGNKTVNMIFFHVAKVSNFFQYRLNKEFYYSKFKFKRFLSSG